MVGIAMPHLGLRDYAIGKENGGLTHDLDVQSIDAGPEFELASWGERISLEPGDALTVDSSRIFLGAVVAGRLVKRATDGPRVLVVDKLDPGDTFLLDSNTSPRGTTAPLFAVCRSIVSLLNRDELLEAFAHMPSLSMSLIADVAQRLARAEERQEEVALASGRTQLARLLLQLTIAHGQTCAYGVSQESMASELGMYRESLTMLLSQFRVEGLVRTGRLSIEILDEAGLRKLADAGTEKWLNGSLPKLDL